MRFLLLLLIVPYSLSGQPKEWNLKGYLGVEGGESYTFKLEFTDSAGHIKGHSYTWLYEEKQVKAAVTGFLDRTNKTLSFKETRILHNKGFESGTTICLIHASLKFKQDKGNSVFTGPITSSDANDVYCGQGSITFQDNEVLRQLFSEPAAPTPKERIVKPSSPDKPMRIIYDTATSKPITRTTAKPSLPDPERLTAGMEKIIDWHTDTVVIEVWDSRVDRDIITVRYNNEKVLDRYVLTSGKKQLRIPVSKTGMDILSIVAENTGNEPPNTAELTLTDGIVQYPIIAFNEAGKSITIKIRRVGKER